MRLAMAGGIDNGVVVVADGPLRGSARTLLLPYCFLGPTKSDGMWDREELAASYGRCVKCEGAARLDG